MTLSSLRKISETIDIEVIVVDNNSKDGLQKSIPQQFSDFHFIFNKGNRGFARANNIGIAHAKSEYILILNPDTIPSESVIRDALFELETNCKVGAVSPKLLDGRGNFLPESIRSFPDLKSGFLKIIGLNRHTNYYNGLNEKGELDVMPGACMFFRRDVYQLIGGLDERYFMYGEDIDICYQLQAHGFKIKYLANSPIIHFKGKSSIKSNWTYQKAFYNAMKIYWKKNLESSNSTLATILVDCAIPLLKLTSFVKHSLKLVWLPIMDFISIYVVTLLFSVLWFYNEMHMNQLVNSKFNLLLIPLYTGLAIVSFFISKLYVSASDLLRILRAALLNMGFVLIMYFILPIEFKYSRAILIGFALISFIIPLLIRWVYSKLTGARITFSDDSLICVRSVQDLNKLKDIVENNSQYRLAVINDNEEENIMEIENHSTSDIINAIRLGVNRKELWLYSSRGKYLIQCHDANSSDYVIAEDKNFIIDGFTARFLKRTFDITTGTMLLVLFWISKRPSVFVFKSAWTTLLGTTTWIYPSGDSQYQPIFTLKESLRIYYKRNYSVRLDLYYLYKFMFISE